MTSQPSGATPSARPPERIARAPRVRRRERASGGVAPASLQPAWTATRPRLRATVSITGTALAVVLVGFFGLVFAVIPDGGADVSPWVRAWHVTGALAALGCGVAMVWRMRAPVGVLVVCAVGAILLPLDPIGTAIALSWVVASQPRRTLAWTVPLGVVAVVVALVRDLPRAVPGAVMASTSSVTGEVSRMSLPGYLAIAVALLVVMLAAGIVRRFRGVALLAQQRASEQVEQTRRLRSDLSRQEERGLIAREMHDTVAHHLSLLSLHAAALEVTSSDPAVPESARAMRDSAHQALEEMRVLIGSLRDSGETGDDGYSGGARQLHDLQRIVDDAARAGVAVAADVRVPELPTPPPALTRAVYRIVQEAFTNALKHAPGSGVSLVVDGRLGATVSLVVSSWLPPGGVRPDHTGAHVGIIGMTERATALGGSLTAGVEGPLWVVRAWLPWRETR